MIAWKVVDRKLIDYLPWYTVLADTVEVIGEVEL